MTNFDDKVPAVDVGYELVQHGEVVASTFGDLALMSNLPLEEIQRYAKVYSADGEVEIYEVTRRRIEIFPSRQLCDPYTR